MAWAALQTCCVIFASRIGRAARNGDKVQIAWQAWHFVRYAEILRKPCTKHRNFEVDHFQLRVKTRVKTSVFGLQLVKIEGSDSWNVRFEASTCLVWSLWLRRVYGGSSKTFRFPMCPSVKLGGSLAGNARFEAPSHSTLDTLHSTLFTPHF